MGCEWSFICRGGEGLLAAAVAQRSTYTVKRRGRSALRAVKNFTTKLLTGRRTIVSAAVPAATADISILFGRQD